MFADLEKCYQVAWRVFECSGGVKSGVGTYAKRGAGLSKDKKGALWQRAQNIQTLVRNENTLAFQWGVEMEMPEWIPKAKEIVGRVEVE